MSSQLKVTARGNLNNRFWGLILSVLGMLVNSHCASVPVIQGELPPPLSREEMILSSGDTIEVKFNFWPELNDTVTIRPDGKISLQLVDEVHVEGMSPERLDQHLTQLYESKIKNPEITVIVRQLSNQRVFVGGEVRTPGPLPLDSTMNLFSAIVEAGGFENKSANPKNVILFRQQGEKRYAKSFDMNHVLSSAESDVVALSPNDIVYVTRKGIDEANEWVDQFIEGLVPSAIISPAALFYTAGN